MLGQNDNGGASRQATLTVHFTLIGTADNAEEPFHVYREGIAARPGGGIGLARMFMGGFKKRVERGPWRDLDSTQKLDPTADDVLVAPGYARALERQQRRFSPNPFRSVA